LESEGVFGSETVGTEGKIFIPHPWLPPSWPAEYTITCDMISETIRVEDPAVPQHFLAPFALEIEHLAACVRENRAPQFPPGADAERDSRAQMHTIEALLESAQNSRVVMLAGA
jgi:predicted dehydrogenase